MTRQEAMCKLLVHGALPAGDARSICGWPAGEAEMVLRQLAFDGMARHVAYTGGRVSVYRLTAKGAEKARRVSA